MKNRKGEKRIDKRERGEKRGKWRKRLKWRNVKKRKVRQREREGEGQPTSADFHEIKRNDL